MLHRGGGSWLDTTKSTEKFLNLTLSLINPGLYHQGQMMLAKLQELNSTSAVTLEWESGYTGIQVICNRVTPTHRDSKGHPEWYDLLTGIAEGSLPQLMVNDLGLELAYYRGSVIGLCGNVLEHQVKAWGNGDRVCYAHFMWEAVRERLGVVPAGWVMQSTYGQYILDEVTASRMFHS